MPDPEPALASAPHLRRFHELQPDVPIVVLPPERTAPAGEPVPDAVLDDERAAVDATLAFLLEQVGASAAEAEVRHLWRAGGVDDTVTPVAQARILLGAERGAVARPLTAALERGGWELRTGRSGRAVHLEGERAGRAVRVVVVEDVVVVTSRGRELPVTTAVQHRLMGAVEEGGA